MDSYDRTVITACKRLDETASDGPHPALDLERIAEAMDPPEADIERLDEAVAKLVSLGHLEGAGPRIQQQVSPVLVRYPF